MLVQVRRPSGMKSSQDTAIREVGMRSLMAQPFGKDTSSMTLKAHVSFLGTTPNGDEIKDKLELSGHHQLPLPARLLHPPRLMLEVACHHGMTIHFMQLWLEYPPPSNRLAWITPLSGLCHPTLTFLLKTQSLCRGLPTRLSPLQLILPHSDLIIMSCIISSTSQILSFVFLPSPGAVASFDFSSCSWFHCSGIMNHSWV